LALILQPSSNALMHGRKSFLGQKFDVVVIGGGITGVAIARECAQRRLRTLIVEKDDFGAGSTSRSTRIVHGGLHLLEHGGIDMMRGILREQHQLLTHSQHLVKPVQFLLAIPNDLRAGLRGALSLRSALWAYKWMNHGIAKNGSSAPANTRTFESNLDGGRTWKVFSYEDAQCEFPERLVAEWLVQSIAAGAEASNHTEVLRINRTAGRVSGVRVREALTQEEGVIGADWVINAAGPWVDLVINGSNIGGKRLVGGLRGSHLVLPSFLTAPKCAVESREPNGEPFFVIPWNGQLLVGTTAVPDYSFPGGSQPSITEIEYLMSRFSVLVPNSGLTKADIRFAFSGVRPVAYGESKERALHKRPSLHHHCEEGVTGLISVIGGTLSTAVPAARDVIRMMGLAMTNLERTFVLPLKEEDLDAGMQQWTYMVAAKAGISNQAACMLAEWYGWSALSVAQIASLDEGLREPLCKHTPHLVAEAVYAFRQECGATLGDLLLRRVPVALGLCWSEACSVEASHKIGAILGWEKTEMNRQAKDLEDERRAFLHPEFGMWQTAGVPVSSETGRTRETTQSESTALSTDQLPYRAA
jgi:glycerol-3-phosphate dehydrogenase